MITKHLLVVSTAVALTAMFTGTAASQNTKTVQTTAPQAPFLTPLPPRFVIPPGGPGQPRVCRELQGPLQCPPILGYGGAAGGGLPTIDPALEASLPNVRVSIVIQSISNEIVSNGGVSNWSETFPLEWYTGSPDASIESSYHDYPLPGPGETWPVSAMIYDAIVFDACDSFSLFRVYHEARIAYHDGIPIDFFQGDDDSTLDALGFYNLSYTIRSDQGPGVSNFHFSGKVNVTCSAADSVH